MSRALTPDRPARPTPAELEILTILWELKSATVRDIYDSLRQERDIGYTTVLKIMQIMTEKGLVTRDTRQRSHIYKPAESKQRTQGSLLGDLLHRAFEGNLHQLVLRAIEDRAASPEELRAIRKLLDENDDR